LGAEEVSLFAREGRIRVNRSIKITRHNMLNQSGELNVLSFAFWQLDPVMQNVVRYPVH
jgi:hypothetical protein